MNKEEIIQCLAWAYHDYVTRENKLLENLNELGIFFENDADPLVLAVEKILTDYDTNMIEGILEGIFYED